MTTPAPDSDVPPLPHPVALADHAPADVEAVAGGLGFGRLVFGQQREHLAHLHHVGTVVRHEPFTRGQLSEQLPHQFIRRFLDGHSESSFPSYSNEGSLLTVTRNS